MAADSPAIPADASPPATGSRAIAWAAVAVAAIWLLAATSPPRSYGDTLFSRLATVYALVHDGTFTIEVAGEPATNPFAARTVDKVRIGGRTISSKPPVLPLFMTAEYMALRALTGWSLEDPEDLARITRVMTYTFCGLPFLVLVWALTRSVQIVAPGNAAAAFLGFAAIAGTQAAAFATVLNNHVPAASAVMLCFLIAIRLVADPSSASPPVFIAFGLAAGFAATVDTPTALFPALLGLVLAPRHLKPLLGWAIPAALVLVAMQSVALYLSAGNALPVQLRSDVYLFENSEWRNPLGVDAINDPRALYLFHITVGRVGIFSLFPVTLLAIPGLILWWRRPDPTVAIPMCAAPGTLVIAAYYVMTTNNYGGSAFGFRWFIVLGPVFLLLAAPAVARFRTALWLVALVLLGVSMVSTYECARRPWQANQEWTVRIFGSSV